MITIKLHGYLEKFSTNEITLHTDSIPEVINALLAYFGDSFRTTLENGSFQIMKGDPLENKFISEEELLLPVEEKVHLFPAITGAGRGFGQIILGVVLIVAAVALAFVTGGAALAGMGAAKSATMSGLGVVKTGFAASATATSLATAGVLSIAGGVMSMLAKPPSIGDYARAGVDRRVSFLFNGVVNNTEQGVPVPLVYGRHLTGSTVIYAGIDVEQI